MSENLLAISKDDINVLSNVLGTPTIPSRYETVQDLVAVVLMGQELGLQPMHAINELFIVNGKPQMSGKTMLGLVHQHGHRITVATSNTKAVATGFRKTEDGSLEEVGSFEFTIEDAEAAGLAGQGAWQTYPADMLGWKAVARCARFCFPECITGYTHHEMAQSDEYPEALEADAAFVLEGEEDIDVDAAMSVDEIVDELDAEVVEG